MKVQFSTRVVPFSGPLSGVPFEKAAASRMATSALPAPQMREPRARLPRTGQLLIGS